MRLYLLFLSIFMSVYSFKKVKVKTKIGLNSTQRMFNISSKDADDISSRMKFFP